MSIERTARPQEPARAALGRLIPWSRLAFSGRRGAADRERRRLPTGADRYWRGVPLTVTGPFPLSSTSQDSEPSGSGLARFLARTSGPSACPAEGSLAEAAWRAAIALSRPVVLIERCPSG